MLQKHVLIVGGGITGLSAAYYLYRQAQQSGVNIEITLVEKQPQFGGKIRTHHHADGIQMEEGPDSFLARKVSAINLCRSLGLEEQLVGTNPNLRKTYIVNHGNLALMPGGSILGIPAEIKPFMSSKLISFSGKLRAGMDIFLPRGNRDGQDESLGHFLRRRMGNELVDRIVEPLLSGIYGGDADKLSLGATFPAFRQMEEEHRSLIIGTVEQRKKMQKKKEASLGSARDTSEGKKQPTVFYSLRDGLQTLSDTLVDRLKQDGIRLMSDTGVIKIEKSGDNKRYAVQLDNGTVLQCDGVLITTPAYVTEKLLHGLTDVTALQEIPYASSAIVGMAFDKDNFDYVVDSSGFVVPKKENRFISACTWITGKWLHMAPKDKIFLRAFTGRFGNAHFQNMTDEEVVEKVREDLRDLIGLTAAPSWTKVVRWNNGMPQYMVGHLERLRQFEHHLKRDLPGVDVAGAAYYGVGVPDCIDQGIKAAERMVAHLTQQQR